MQREPNSAALRTPFHGSTGCGAFHRKAPTGGAANGIPRKTRTPGDVAATPSTTPLSVFTRSSPSAPVAQSVASTPAKAANRAATLILLITSPYSGGYDSLTFGIFLRGSYESFPVRFLAFL